MRNLLFVDDNEMLVKMMREFLADRFNVKGFTSSKDAYEYIIDNPDKIDIVMVDYKMPVYNGLELLKRAQTANSKSVRIIITGYADEDGLRNGPRVYDHVINKKNFRNIDDVIKPIESLISSIK